MRMLLVLPLFVGISCAALAESPDFDRQIAPLIAEKCLDCHSGAKPEGKLDLSKHKSASDGGESGPAIVASDLEKSQLWQRVSTDEMPPKKPLTAAEKELFRAWIASGAKWGSDPIDRFALTTSSRAGRDWWSLRPIERPQVPAFDAKAGNAIDGFIRQRLVAAKLAPSSAASPATLIRRLSFDLTGLPPSPDDVQRFMANPSPEAYAELVDRLLASPQYGERWARHWLDIAHFGESDGFEFDRMRPHAWPYRDWVIAALNRDMPYDEFARLQIAGDVLHPNDADSIIAAGFLVHGAFDSLKPAGETMRQIMRQDELEDIVGLVGQSFLGLTVHCARCHDHKFDPITAEDYYRLASSLAGVRRGERNLPSRPVPSELTERLTAVQRELKQLEDIARERVAKRDPQEARRMAPQPLVAFEFEDVDKSDIKLQGEAKLTEGALVVDGKEAYAASAPLSRDIREKTLEAWVKLSTLEQRGGAAISLQTLDGQQFDAIVFGERDPGEWMAGSEFFKRYARLKGSREQAKPDEVIHLAITYAADGKITAYRNGEVYGSSYQATEPVTFKAGEAQLVFGVRHTPAANGKMLAGRIERGALYNRSLTAAEVAASAAAYGKVITQEQLLAALSAEEGLQYAVLASEAKLLGGQIASLRSPKAYTITPAQPEGPTHLLLRGNPQSLGEVVAAGGLSCLSDANFDMPPDAPEGERRKRLAAWITRAENPLFARTIVNRVWHYHFGRGLIETPSDLGFNGGRPSHPELLDYLASELIASGWSLKHLHRLIVSSATYRQSSSPRDDAMAIDADNRLLWRFSPKRLDAESLRDAVLAASGELNPQQGGPSFQDFRAYDNHNSQYYEPIDKAGHEYHRRSIYRMWARGGKAPLLDTFDCPDPSTSTPQRGSTTTPLQALSLLNNSFMLRMSESMAKRLERESGPEAEAQVTRAFELALGRPPSKSERDVAVGFVKRNGAAAFCRVLLNTNGFLYVE